MPRDVFGPHSEGVLRSLLAGVSAADAARKCGISVRTVSTWLANGREDPNGRYGDFARQVDERRAQRYDLPADATVMDADELLVVVSEMARGGSVQAMKLAWEMLRAQRVEGEPEPDLFSMFDGPTLPQLRYVTTPTPGLW